LKILKVSTEKEDPHIILNTMYLNRQRENNPPFYLSLDIKGLCLNNCMLDFGALANVMSFEVMEQLGLKTTQPYGNVCGVYSKRVKVFGVCEDIDVFLMDFPHISILVDIIVIDVPYAWGMILSRSWYFTLGVFLSMSLTHAYIPMDDGTYEILHSQEKNDKHVMDPNGLDYVSECDYDVPPQIIEYDPSNFPFM
jgi:hypothetical protein